VRQIVLDTETTGLEPAQGHRVIEIGCVELVNRRQTGNSYHQYLNPERDIDEGAAQVHGITSEQLQDKPLFGDVVQELLEYLRGAELVIHNAPFDVGFLNHELKHTGHGPITEVCTVLDTLEAARRLHPGQKNTLDALCKRYEIDNSHRQLHGALLDAEILADVYLAMTGGQCSLALDEPTPTDLELRSVTAGGTHRPRLPIHVIRASAQELEDHEQQLRALDKASGGNCVWRRLDDESQARGK